jgi:hypothetical protein
VFVGARMYTLAPPGPAHPDPTDPEDLNQTQLQLGGVGGPVPVGTVTVNLTGAFIADEVMATLNGGTVKLKSGSLWLPQVTVATDTTLNIATGQTLTLGDMNNAINGNATMLTETGAGTLVISGALTPAVTVTTGTLQLTATAGGNGAIQMNGGTLVGTANTGYTGAITFAAGAIEGTGMNPFGTGMLTIGVPTSNLSANLTLAAAVSIGNSIIINMRGTLTLNAVITCSGTVTVNSGGVLKAMDNVTFAAAVMVDGGTLETAGAVTFNGTASVSNNGTKGTLATGGIVNFNNAVQITSGVIGANGNFTFSGQTTFADLAPGDAPNLGAAGTYIFAGGVVIATPTLLWQGNITVTGSFILNQTTTLITEPGSHVHINGGASGGQQLTLKAAAGNSVVWHTHTNIGACTLIAGSGCTIVCYQGFQQSNGGLPTEAGGTVQNKLTTPYPGS